MRKIYFEIEVPEGQVIDTGVVEGKLSKVIETILPNARVKETSVDMADYEEAMKAETLERAKANKLSAQKVKDASAEIDRRIKEFSDDDLPEHVKFMPKEFRERAKRNIIIEQYAQEEE